MSPKREYDKPAVTVDCVILCSASTDSRETLDEATTGTHSSGPNEPYEILLIQRAKDPFANKWALPGGFVNKDEPLARAASRELEEETGMRTEHLEQVGAFGDPGRDPRGWTISVAYFGVVATSQRSVSGRDDAKEARWFPLENLPPLAFDHAEIISSALRTRGLIG